MISAVKTSSIILLASTPFPQKFIFGAYDGEGKATSFLQLPEDHKLFVETLTGYQTVMGVKTLMATPVDFPDAGRICVTHHPEDLRPDAIPAQSIKQGIEMAKKRAKKAGQDRIYVIGGASIIQQCLAEKLLDEVVLTIAYNHFEAVSHPVYLEFNLENWVIKRDSGLLTSASSLPANLPYRFLTLSRKESIT